MDLSWWTAPHTNEVLNIIMILLLAWGIHKILSTLRNIEGVVSRLTKAVD